MHAVSASRYRPVPQIIVSKVRESFRTCGHLSLRKLHVTVKARTVMLHGNVPSYYLKQLAQTVAGAVEGVTHVVNNTIVCR